MEEKKTSRGFAYVEFVDLYGAKCSLQKSSLATEDAIWFGCNDPSPKQFVPNGNPSWRDYPLPENVQCTTRMHLSREQVAELLPHLVAFVRSGEIQK